MSLEENTAGPWLKLSVFGELGSNKAGRQAARENREVFRKPIHPLPRPAVGLNILVQVTPSSAAGAAA